MQPIHEQSNTVTSSSDLYNRDRSGRALLAGQLSECRFGGPRDLIARRVRRELRELAVDTGILRTIAEAFEDEGFGLAAEPDYTDGMRRGLFDAYDKGIDWRDRSQVAKAIRVFEEILSWGVRATWSMREDPIIKIRRLLDYDGYTLDDELRIHPQGFDVPPLGNKYIGDATAMQEHLARLNGAIEDDPALAISQAKALIEATTKWVLEQLGERYNDKANITVLIKKAQKALKVHPDAIAPSKKGRETIVRVLSNLSQVAMGVAELRNEYGSDHGRTRSSGGLGPRHARLAAGMAHTYCQFLLETLSDHTLQAQRSEPRDPGSGSRTQP